ncbi:YibE/F family protein [Corynebacterium canis]|uniref:YibE/F family protein n=1 Tax=Corynebacterium canis TaxID=679663 RepID=A0A5C5UK74_9CORY|nr:YibE/F family protein [Corynebacterium canis]TWT26604.1 YibE/F family protein [Corynebacterium canis]WJY76386.1 YibE/F-like protein [Corynebacterium canis]
MGRHSSQPRPTFPPPSYEYEYEDEPPAPQRGSFTVWQWLLTFLLVGSFLATSIGLVLLWPSSDPPRVAPEFNQTSPLPQTQVDGRIIIRDTGDCNSPSVGRVFDTSPVTSLEQRDEECQHAIVEILEGDNKGKRTLLMVSEKPGDPDLYEGETIRMSETTAADGSHAYTFTDFQRNWSLAIWLGLTALCIVLIGLGPGIRSLLGLGLTFAAVALFLLPALLHGGPPLLLAVVCGSAVLFPVLYIVHGISWKTSSALAGTLLSLGLAAGLAHFAIASNQLRGLGDEDNLLIQLYLPDVTVTGLMLCGFIVGALGVLNDVTIAQASTINELAEIEPDASPWRLFAGAMKVGRDHIASMMYTLVLSYTGAALPLLLLLSVANRPIMQVLASDVMATELLRSAIGALALTMAVPITTLIAAFTVNPQPEELD